MRIFGCFLLVLGLLGGCVVKKEFKDGTREMLGEVDTASLTLAGDGSGTVDFVFKYGLGIVDSEGIAQVDWVFRLVDREERTLGTVAQRMRKPEMDKTEILVTGERKRRLPVTGEVRAGVTYVLWISLSYRGELLGEVLAPVSAGGGDAF